MRLGLPRALVLVPLLVACEGTIGSPGGSSDSPRRTDETPSTTAPTNPGRIDPDAPAVDDVTAAPVRRLGNDELASALESLLGVAPSALAELPGDVADRRVLLFPAIAGRQVLVPVDTWLNLADQAAAGTNTVSLAPTCASARDRSCAAELVGALANRAFRRDATSEEHTALLALYDAAGNHDDGVAQIVRAIVLSPSFLYVIESGTVVDDDLVALDDRSIATRLALALTDDLPDAELRAEAEAGRLRTAAQIRAQAERLFDGTKARATVTRFFDHWLGLTDVAALVRDADAFPTFDAALNASMLEETRTFVDHVVFEAGAPLPELFSADYSFVDARLGALYGLDVAGEAPVRVTLPPERRGVLTHASVLVHEQGSIHTRPIQRSLFLLRRVLCAELPPPPTDVAATPQPSEAGATTRQTYERLTSTGTCAGCHVSAINPPGFAFEDFDALGAHRATERGLPVDASGGLPAYAISDVRGGAEMATAVASLDEVHVCFARQWLRFALARVETQADATSIRHVADVSRAGGSLRDVMLALTETFAMRHRTVPTE